MSRSNRTDGLPPEGSKVRLIGLKNPDLNEKLGIITSYSRGGERVMIALNEGGTPVKVKPKQVEVIEEPSGGARPGLNRRNSSRTQLRTSNSSRDVHSGHQQRERNGTRQDKKMRRVGSTDSVSQASNGGMSHMSSVTEELMETLGSADAMFDLADTSGDGVITQSEFEYYMKKHTNHDSKMIRECFLLIDIDNNGDINREEVRNAFLKKRRETTEGAVSDHVQSSENELLEVSRDADALFDKADHDKNGSLTIKEFEMYMRKNTKHSDDLIHHLFASMDSDSNGVVTRNEIRQEYLKHRKSGEKKSLMEILGLEDDEMADIDDDVYNMFFLSDSGGHSFWFAIIVWILKLLLILIIGVDLFTTGEFPDSADVPFLVKTTQFLLLPVNVSVQEELITTFFVYANVKWSKHILQLNPGASKGKYHFANLMRFMDGLSFLFINTVLLMQATEVLGAFLNFAALQFLSSIDNVALHLARDGYLTESLEKVAGDVLVMKLPRNHNDRVQYLDSLLFVITYMIVVVAWILFHFML